MNAAPHPGGPWRIALLGAESTGKTWLAQALADDLRARGLRVGVVPEVLRDWVAREGRTPRPHEQPAIAAEQARQVLALADHAVVIADTTPLMTAVYSDWLFGDPSLYDFGLAHQRLYTHTLLTGLDLPWQADGLQRDGPHVRAPVDARLRAALGRAGLPYQVIYGRGVHRLAAARAAVGLANASVLIATDDQAILAKGQKDTQSSPGHRCDGRCSDPDCERRLFTALLGR